MALEDEFDPQAARLRAAKSDANKFEAWIKWLAKQEGKSDEAFLKAILVLPARKIFEKKRLAWLEEAAKKARVMTECNTTKTSPPAGYWEAEHKAHQIFQQAEAYLAEVEKEV